MLADLPPAYHLVLAQAPTPPSSTKLEVSSPPMLVMGTPDSAFLWPITTLAAPDPLQMVISARLVHPAWKARTSPFASESYVLQAEPFDLAALRDGKLKRLKASLSKVGSQSPEWKDVQVRVRAVPWHNVLNPNGASVPRLLYRIVGSPEATYLVHEVSGEPDFHHVVRVKFKNRRFTEAELARGLYVDVADRPNTPASRLKLGDSPADTLLEDKPVEFTVERELLFREVQKS
jgi:hypothetical protein